MLYICTGTDRKKSRDAMNMVVAKVAKNAEVIRITDAHTLDDLAAALGGGGLFGGVRVVILDSVFARDDMRERIEAAAARMAAAADHFFICEEKLDAAARKLLEKHAAQSERFDAPKKPEAGNSIFAMGNALRARDKKNLWISYQRELLAETAPEAIHGVLFWAAKQQLLAARTDADAARGKKLIKILAELPHEARRRGEDLEYALERFALSHDVVS